MKNLVFCIAFLSLISACNYQNEEELFVKSDENGLCEYESVKLDEVNAVLTNYGCIACHNNSSASGNINLEGHSNLKIVVENEKLLGTIKHEIGYSKMPQGASKMSDCDIKLIETWIQEGYQNN